MFVATTTFREPGELGWKMASWSAVDSPALSGSTFSLALFSGRLHVREVHGNLRMVETGPGRTWAAIQKIPRDIFRYPLVQS